jgi:nucleoside-diphosphate-sugar epimerase
MKNKIKTLITGGAGTIGFFLGKRLAEQGQEVILADNLSRGKIDLEVEELLKMPNVKFIQLDVTDLKQFEKLDFDYDYVYHLAAINGTKYFYEIPEKVLRVGVLGVINVLEWFKEQKRGKILFTSSNEAYASYINLQGNPIPTPETVPLCIDDVTNPRWSYGGGKIIGELFFINYGRAYKFPMSIVRYHNSYGPRMGLDHVMPEFLGRIIRKEEPFKIFGAQETRSYCYVEDTVRATQMVMESEKTNGEIVHIGNDREEISALDLAKKMFRLFNYQPQKMEIHEAPKGCVKRRCPDLTKIRKLISYEPTVNLDEGLKKTYEWYKNKF